MKVVFLTTSYPRGEDDFAGRFAAELAERLRGRGHSDGLPVVCAEAMAHARPVVASAVGGLPDMVRDAETGLLSHRAIPPRCGLRSTASSRTPSSACASAEPRATG